jgi:hypothetical protein
VLVPSSQRSVPWAQCDTHIALVWLLRARGQGGLPHMCCGPHGNAWFVPVGWNRERGQGSSVLSSMAFELPPCSGSLVHEQCIHTAQ